MRALKLNGGADADKLTEEDLPALEQGLANLKHHLDIVRGFGVPPIVALNRFTADSEAELARIRQFCNSEGVPESLCEHWAKGGAGAAQLASKVCQVAESGVAELKFSYNDELPLLGKVRAVAQQVYKAGDVVAEKKSRRQFTALEEAGYGNLPVCMAKTPYSFTADPSRKGAPEGFELPIRDVRLSAGAGFVVVLCGDLFTMPGLPRNPSAEHISVNGHGEIEGLF